MRLQHRYCSCKFCWVSPQNIFAECLWKAVSVVFLKFHILLWEELQDNVDQWFSNDVIVNQSKRNIAKFHLMSRNVYLYEATTPAFQHDITTLRSGNEDGDVDVGTWKFVHYACAKSRKTIFQGSVKRDGREKVSFDVLMKTGNILSKIMVILDIYGIKMLTTFTTEYHTIFFGFILKDWECIKCFACFFFLLFFASKQCRAGLEK